MELNHFVTFRKCFLRNLSLIKFSQLYLADRDWRVCFGFWHHQKCVIGHATTLISMPSTSNEFRFNKYAAQAVQSGQCDGGCGLGNLLERLISVAEQSDGCEYVQTEHCTKQPTQNKLITKVITSVSKMMQNSQWDAGLKV